MRCLMYFTLTSMLLVRNACCKSKFHTYSAISEADGHILLLLRRTLCGPWPGYSRSECLDRSPTSNSQQLFTIRLVIDRDWI